MMEFSLASLTPGNVGLALFKPYANQVTGFTTGSTPTALQWYGYIGNGAPQAAYGTTYTNPVFSNPPVSAIGYLSFDATSWIQSVLNQGGAYVGFMAVPTNSGGAVEFNGGYFSQYPNSYLDVYSPINISAGTTTVATDNDLGVSGDRVVFNGGTLAVSQSFTTTRLLTIAAAGSEIVTSPIATLTLAPSQLTWQSGATLSIGGSGTVSFAQTGGQVSVSPVTTLHVLAGANASISGTTDSFTDTATSGNHVTLINDGTFAVNTTSTIARITGAGTLVVGGSDHLSLSSSSGVGSQNALIIQTGGQLDLGNNNLIIGTGTPIDTIVGYVNTGRNSGVWNGSGIISSNLKTDVTRTLVVVSGADYHAVTGSTLFSGQHYFNSDTLVRSTLIGDANFDNTVNTLDFTILANHFSASSQNWVSGDFTGDGAVNALDFNALASHFGETFVPLGAVVPEPACFGVIAVLALAARRRRMEWR